MNGLYYIKWLLTPSNTEIKFAEWIYYGFIDWTKGENKCS